MIRDKQTERWNFVAVNNEKRPFIKDWQFKSWGQKTIWKGQTAAGLKQSINHTTIDVDLPEMNDKIDKLFWDKSVLIKSGSGKRHIIIAQTEDSWSIPNSHLMLGDRKAADLLVSYNKQAVSPNFWDLNLPTSDKYQLLNGKEHDFFNPPKANLIELISELGLEFRKPKTIDCSPAQTPSTPSKIVFSERYTNFDITNYVPTSFGQTSGNMADLLRAIHFFGLEDKSDEIFANYIYLSRQNGFGHHPDEVYEKQWKSWNRGFNKNKIQIQDWIPLKAINLKQIITKNLYNQQPLEENISLQLDKRVNREFVEIVKGVCRDLSVYSKDGSFFLTTDWSEFNINQARVHRALGYLIKAGIIKLVKKGTAGKENGKPSKFIYV